VPAIQPARLRQQAALLADHFDNPTAYMRSLHHLLDFYAERTRHPGRSGSPAPMMDSYKVRHPILRMILLELTPLAIANPASGLVLCDALWSQPYLEFHMLGAMLLGQIPPKPPGPVIQRLKAWLTPELEDYLIEAIMEHSFVRLRAENPKAVVDIIQEWLNRRNSFYQQLGLRALLPLIQQPEYQNMPVFYRLIQPFASRTPVALRPDLLDVLAALAQRSPQETSYFLKKTLAIPDSADTPWLIRQLITQFPPEIQAGLREAEKTASARQTRF